MTDMTPEIEKLIERLRAVRKTNPFAGHVDLCDAAADALAAQQGRVMVPREPTKSMLDAGYAAAAFPRDPEICVAMWKAMWDAAAKLAQSQERTTEPRPWQEPAEGVVTTQERPLAAAPDDLELPEEPKNVAWLIERPYNKTTCVVSPLTDKHHIDYGDEAWALVKRVDYDSLLSLVGKLKERINTLEQAGATLLMANAENKRKLAEAEGAYKATEGAILKVTEKWDEHPDDYDGPCMCKECLSYGC